MEPAQPGPGEELNTGAVTTPRLATSVIVLRGGDRELEVLLVQRNPASRFMGGAWVFPGGAVDAADGEGEAALRAAGVREVAEEAGHRDRRPGRARAVLALDHAGDGEDPLRHLVLPRARVGRDGAARRRRRVRRLALEHAAGRARRATRPAICMLVFPTIKHLEQLAGFPHAHALVEHARGRPVEPVEPRVVLEGEVARVLLPGDPGYEAVEAPAEA